MKKLNTENNGNTTQFQGVGQKKPGTGILDSGVSLTQKRHRLGGTKDQSSRKNCWGEAAVGTPAPKAHI